jgi:cell wall-associated NlpC family hydrolase
VKFVAREQWIAEVRSWIGVPWRHQGRNRHGVDCIGLVICSAHALGLTDFDFRAYGRVPMDDLLMRLCDEQMERQHTAEIGDVLLMRLRRLPQHFAVLVEPRRIVHARGEDGRVVETTLPDAWVRRIAGVYTVPGVV